MSNLMVRISLISFLSLILITGFSFKVNTNFSENKGFFYSMNTVSLVYAGDDDEGEGGGGNEGDPLNCDPGQHEENGKCVPDSPEPLNCDPGQQRDSAGNCVPKNANIANLAEHQVCEEGYYEDEGNDSDPTNNVCKPCDEHSEEEECKDEEEEEEEEGSIPLELVKILLNFNQVINEGFQCDQIKVKDRNIVLCREGGITKQVIVPQNPNTCLTQTENIALTGTLRPQEIRLLADFDPCIIQDGTITLNMPNTQDIKIAALYLDKIGNNHKGILINPGQIQTLIFNQGLFKLSLGPCLTGKDVQTGLVNTLTKINAIALFNNGDFLIQFGPNNAAALSAILAQGAPGLISDPICVPYLPGKNMESQIQFSPFTPSTDTSLPPSNTTSPMNTLESILSTDILGSSSTPLLSLENLNTLDQNQLIDAISSKISQLRTFEKNKITQTLFDLTQATAAKGGDVMNNLRQIGTKILQNPSDPLIDKIIGIANTK